MKKPEDINEYISSFPEESQKILEDVRETIQKAAPEAKEVISYGMPAFKGNKVLVWFAGYKNHIGFYPYPTALAAFKKEISQFKSSKGAVQFPIGEPMPLDLIIRMVKFRVKEDKENELVKK